MVNTPADPLMRMVLRLALVSLLASLLAPLAGCSSHGSASPADAGDAATPVDAAPDGAPAAINAPPDVWTWIDFPESRCGDGSPTGIGINPHAGATRLLLFLQGGGECTDGPSCWGANNTASNIAGGYDGDDFATEPTLLLAPFDRATGNPFADADMVFVPYCTGDLHVGTAMATFTVNGAPKPTYFYGGTDLDMFMASLALTFPSLDRVWLMGISAGGFGTFLNQDFVAKAFNGIRVDIIDDSGPAINNPVLGVPMQWGPQLPESCSNCFTATNIFDFDRKTYPSTRYGLMTYQTDTELPMYYDETPAMFAQQIAAFVASLKPDPNAKSFVALSSGHVVLIEMDPTADAYINSWLTQFAGDDPAWSSESH
jgi:hypothetical protein